MHQESCIQMHSSQLDMDETRARHLAWVDRHVRERGAATREVRTALRRATRPYRYPRLGAVLDGTRRRRFLTDLGRRVGRVVMPRGLRDRLRDAWRVRTRPEVEV